MRASRRFAALILTHGRPNNVITLRSLEKSGFTGEWVLVVDNEDATAEEYVRKFGKDRVAIFDKAAIAKSFDTADLSSDRRAVVFARRAAFEIARERGIDYFVQLDDDYTDFLYRLEREGEIRGTTIRSIDEVIEATLDFLDASGALAVAWSQGGDHMGGVGALAGLRRKAMNSFFVRTDRPVGFVGRLNEDVNAYVVDGSRGALFLTTMTVQLNQVATQQGEGGMTGAYLDAGTYVKSFFSVMMAPSCVRVGSLGRTDRRFHHAIAWDNAVPKIVSGRFRKGPVPGPVPPAPGAGAHDPGPGRRTRGAARRGKAVPAKPAARLRARGRPDARKPSGRPDRGSTGKGRVRAKSHEGRRAQKKGRTG